MRNFTSTYRASSFYGDRWRSAIILIKFKLNNLSKISCSLFPALSESFTLDFITEEKLEINLFLAHSLVIKKKAVLTLHLPDFRGGLVLAELALVLPHHLPAGVREEEVLGALIIIIITVIVIIIITVIVIIIL